MHTAHTESANLLPVYENRVRLPSQYLRELTRGKFVIKYADITLLEIIGEGMQSFTANFSKCIRFCV